MLHRGFAFLVLSGLVVGAPLVHASDLRVVGGDDSDHDRNWVAAFSGEGAGLLPGHVELTVVQETLTMTQLNGFTAVVGEVLNGGEVPVLPYWIQVSGLDDAGELVAAGSAQVYGQRVGLEIGPTLIELIPPGETGWFSVLLRESDDQRTETVQLKADGLEQDLGLAELSLELAADWHAEPSSAFVRLTNSVRNTGAVDVVGLNVTVAVRGESGELLAVARATPPGDRIGGFIGGARAGSDVEVVVILSLDEERLEGATIETRLGGRVYAGGFFQYGVVGLAHAPGVGGAAWRSSLGLTNLSGHAGSARLTFRHGGGRSDVDVSLAEGETIVWDDVVRTLFGVNGAAAGYVQIGASVPLTVTGRTSNESPSGGYGQALPVYTGEMTLDLVYGPPGVISPLRGGDVFRSNLGLVNMGLQSCPVEVRLYDVDGTFLTNLGSGGIGPTRWIQYNDVVPVGVENVYATVEVLGGCQVWAYASVIDETTGDPTTVVVALEDVVNLNPSRAGGVRPASPWAPQGP